SNQANYYRYQILTDGRIIRSQWLPREGSPPNYNNGPELNSGCTNTNNTTTWRNCTRVTPTSRTEEEERNNYATWFSYHRTRMKSAKAGASEAFGALGSRYRVGYDSIWRRGNGKSAVSDSKSAENAMPVFPIPVARDSVEFEEDNGNEWYDLLFSTGGSEQTPQQRALTRTRNYYENRTGHDGAWGPGEVSQQLSCRQSFAILP